MNPPSSRTAAPSPAAVLVDSERIQEILRRFFREHVPDCEPALLEDGQSLLESGVLDSFGVMMLLSFVEEEFHVTIPADEIEPANFETVAAIATMVETRLR